MVDTVQPQLENLYRTTGAEVDQYKAAGRKRRRVITYLSRKKFRDKAMKLDAIFLVGKKPWPAVNDIDTLWKLIYSRKVDTMDFNAPKLVLWTIVG